VQKRYEGVARVLACLYVVVERFVVVIIHTPTSREQCVISVMRIINSPQVKSYAFDNINSPRVKMHARVFTCTLAKICKLALSRTQCLRAESVEQRVERRE
jgi:hypothetical protein